MQPKSIVRQWCSYPRSKTDAQVCKLKQAIDTSPLDLACSSPAAFLFGLIRCRGEISASGNQMRKVQSGFGLD